MNVPQLVYCENCKKVVKYTAERLVRDGRAAVDIVCAECHWLVACFHETEYAPDAEPAENGAPREG